MQLVLGRQRNLADDLAGHGLEEVSGPARLARHVLATDEVSDFAHGVSPPEGVFDAAPSIIVEIARLWVNAK
jgi:hypothetical protein